MDAVAMLLVLHLLNIFYTSQGQCTSNGTCVCHCEYCSSGCTTCLPGWSGSTTNYCQKSNKFFHLIAMDELFDGDSNTYEIVKAKEPYVQVQLNTSTKIDQLDITLELENGIDYTFSLKQNQYKSVPSEICSKLSFRNESKKQTITVTCNQQLQGKYIDIVATSSSNSQETILKVFEIERFECSNGTYGENCSKICSDGCNKLCDKDTGDCVCKNGRWGKVCNQTCPSFCDKSTCDSNTGDCDRCIPGYYGLKCDNKCSVGCQDACEMTSGSCLCKPGYYLTNCTLKCSSTCLDSECHQEKGTCLACNNGTYGDLCDLKCFGECNGPCDKEGICGSCAEHKYGTYCNQTCPRNCEVHFCDRNTGICEKCKIGYMGDICDEICPDNCEICDRNGYKCKSCVDKWYGVKCEIICPFNCGNNGSCDKELGTCSVCPAGYFGKSCTQRCSENCDSSRICDQITGQCQNCIAGRYGLNCSEYCSIHCMKSKCLSNQTCVLGCEDGWFGAQCDMKCNFAALNCKTCDLEHSAPVCRQCQDGWYINEKTCLDCPENCSSCLSEVECLECKNNFYYGTTCNLTCNTACKNKTCNITGYCKEGCEDGKFGSKCEQNCLKPCKTCHNSTMCLECQDGYFGEACEMCSESCAKCKDNSKCTQCIMDWSIYDGKCMKNKNSTSNITGDENNVNHGYSNDRLSSTVIAIIVVIPIMIVILGLVFCLIVGQMKQKWKNRGKTSTHYTIEPVSKRTDHHYENTGISIYNTRGSHALLEEIDPDENSNDADINEFESHNYVNVTLARISLQRLWEYKLQNTANDCINTEFKNLPTGLLLKCEEAKKFENKKRNRYKNVYPYDANRVRLSTDGEKKCNNSYVNASYINGFEASKEYIASQGPFTDETVTDFWRMVWKENVNTIVILTNLEENGVKKCKKYWPSTETMYEVIHVKTLSSDSSSCYKVRRFQITLENESRTVEQFHFTAWPDKGVPSTVNSILDFRRKIRSKADITSPIIVHCSAGIGRTGTFIALDFLINQGQKEGSVDVVSCVTNLRYQRTHLVQTVEQYNYLYGAVTKELTGKETGIQENEFMTYYSQMKRINQSKGRMSIEEEFNLIEKLVPDIDENRYQTAKAVNNKHKNRHSNILADDNFRIYINRQGSDYINAIPLPSAQQNFAYIITHTPLPETVDDFFSMMADQEVLTIVQLDNDADEVFRNRCRSKKWNVSSKYV